MQAHRQAAEQATQKEVGIETMRQHKNNMTRGGKGSSDEHESSEKNNPRNSGMVPIQTRLCLVLVGV